MIDQESSNIYESVWRSALSMIGIEHEDRLELASIAAWSAVHCGRVNAIAESTGRSRWYVSEKMKKFRLLILLNMEEMRDDKESQY